jgi:hypothetical protein
MVDRHPEYLSVPVDHGAQVGRDQPVVQQLWTDYNFGIHFLMIYRCVVNAPNTLLFAWSCFSGIVALGDGAAASALLSGGG